MYLILGLLIAVGVILVLRPWERRACRWRQDSRSLIDGRIMFTCVACGAQTALPKGRTPTVCLADKRR